MSFCLPSLLSCGNSHIRENARLSLMVMMFIVKGVIYDHTKYFDISAYHYMFSTLLEVYLCNLKFTLENQIIYIYIYIYVNILNVLHISVFN